MARISLLIGNLGGGGAQGVCVTLANALANRGHDVEIVVLSLSRARRLDEVVSGVRVVDLQVTRARYAWPALAAHYHQSEIDSVLVFVLELWLLLMAARWWAGDSYRVVVRTINTLSKVKSYSRRPMRRSLDWVLRRLYRRADHVIAQSWGMATELVSLYGVPRERLTVVANPAPARYLHDRDDWTPPPLQVPYLLYAGRLEPQKGLDRLLDAFASISAEAPETHLALVGEGAELPELKKRAAELDVLDRVHFRRFQLDLLPWYRSALATVLTSHYEGLPNVLIESIASGTPVISFNCASGPSDIIQPGVNGYLVPQDDIDELKNALLKIIARPFPKASVKSTALQFDPETIVSLYESVIAPPPVQKGSPR